MIVGLDLGQTIGWVRGKSTGPIEHGSFPLKETTDLGAWVASADDGLRKALRGATGVAIEEPFMGRSKWPARKLYAMLGHIYYMGFHYGMSTRNFIEVPNATGKLTLAGMGNAQKTDMIAAAERVHGLVGLNEHEADALGIWHVYVFGKQEPIRKARTRSSKGIVMPKLTASDLRILNGDDGL